METWQNLVPILSRMIEAHEPRVKFLFKMIKDTVVHLESGILSDLPGGDDQLWGLNSWLFFNTIRAIAAHPDNEDIQEMACQLQNEIFTACQLKQAHLLYDLLENVTVLMEFLTEGLETNSFCKQTLFIDTRKRPVPAFADINFDELLIDIKTKQELEAVVLAEMRFYCHVVTVIGLMNGKSMLRVSKIATMLMAYASMNVKIEVLRYFSTLYKVSMPVEVEEHQYIVENLSFWANLMRHKSIWTENEEIFDFDELSVQLKSYFKSIVHVNPNSVALRTKLCYNFCTLLMNAGGTLLDNGFTIWQVRQIAKLAIKGLRRMSVRENIVSTDWLIEALKYVEVIPEILLLFPKSIAIQDVKGEHKILLAAVIQKIDLLAEKTKNLSVITLDVLERILLEWQAVFILINNTQEILISTAQQKKLNETRNVSLASTIDTTILPEFKNLEPILKDIVCILLEQLYNIPTDLTIEFTVFLMDFAFHTINLFQTLQISDKKKANLFYLLLSPFCKTNRILYKKLPKAVTDCYNKISPTDSTQHAVIHKGLRLTFSVSHEEIKDQEFMQILESVLENTMSSSNDEMKDICIELLTNYLLTSHLNIKWSYERIISPAFKAKRHLALAKILEDLIGLSCSESFTLRTILKPEIFDLIEYKIMLPTETNTICTCEKKENISWDTELLAKMETNYGILLKCQMSDEQRLFLKEILVKFMNLFNDEFIEVKLAMLKCLPLIIQYTPYGLQEPYVSSWLSYYKSKDANLIAAISSSTKDLMNKIDDCLPNDDPDKRKVNFNVLVLKQVVQSIDYAMTCDINYQSDVLNILVNFTSSKIANQDDVLDCFQFATKFMITSTSKVSKQAHLAIEKICKTINTQPLQLLNWYKQRIIDFIMKQVAGNYASRNVKLVASLRDLPKAFGFISYREFTIKYHKLMIACLLPLVTQAPKLEHVLMEISEICNKDLVQLLISSYLTVFTFAYINYSAEMATKISHYITKSYSGSVSDFMVNTETNKNIPEVLCYYRKSPECVIQVFKQLLNDTSNSKEDSLAKMSEYLTKRFLAILDVFQNNITSDGERFIRTHTLLSLGEIIRFMGTKRITPFRFKIFTLLNSALTINEKFLNNACIEVWKIFVRTVDMIQLGSLLSSIFVTLKPLIDELPEEIDEILTYLVIENGNLMSSHFPDIFFLDELPFRQELKQRILAHQKPDVNKTFIDLLEEYIRHIRHENIIVRGFGLKYLVGILRKHRTELNNLIISESVIHPILGGLLRNLMLCCKERDSNLQQYAAECIGELGAFEPSHLAPDYKPHSAFAFSIHSDEFAKLALQELCRAYQVQTDTRGVDCFALAIQEILVSKNVDLESKKNLHIWEAIPSRMRPLMEPLLSSFYTNFKTKKIVTAHPIFGSTDARTCEEWAFNWATRIIDGIPNKDTRNALEAFLPSIKRDMNTLSLIFPYIVLHAIQANHSNLTAIRSVREELNAILKCMIKTEGNLKCTTLQCDAGVNEFVSINTFKFIASQKSSYVDSQESANVKCAKIVFGIFDFLERYLREFVIKYQRGLDHDDYKSVKHFIESFDPKVIALANYHCQEYARALWYIETYIKFDSSNRLENELTLLAKIHAELFDFDSVEGAMALKSEELSLEEKILLYNVTGRLHESAVCFERIMQIQELTPELMKDIVECYLGLDQPETALLMSKNFYQKFSEEHPEFTRQSTCAEPLWRLSRWDDLENLISLPGIKETESWGVNCGQLLLDFRGGEHEKFNEEINQIRLSLLRVLKTYESEQSLYQKCYSQILKLHMLTELQKAEELMYEIKTNALDTLVIRLLSGMLSDWSSRNELLQPRFQIMEPLLCLRRIILNELKVMLQSTIKERPKIAQEVTSYLEENIGKLWIQSTEFASKANMYQQAALYVFNADNYKLPDLFIHKAKLSWEKDDQANAFKILDKGISDMMQLVGADVSKFTKEDKKLCGEAQLLIASYNAKSMNVSVEFNSKLFKEAIKTYPETEKGFLLYAEYTDRLFNAMPKTEQNSTKGREYLYTMIQFYGKSLMYGCNHVHQSMNRLLSIWLDYTSQRDSESVLTVNMNRLIQRYTDALPKFMFFSTFSQLVSRICHPNQEVFTILKTILVGLIQKYPQQSLWMILAVYKSTYENRVKRCSEVLRDHRLHSMQKFIWEFNEFTERLLYLTNADPTTDQNRGQNIVIYSTVSKLAPKLLRFFETHKHVQILLPIEKYLLLTMPPSRDRDKAADLHEAFPNKPVYIQNIREEITVLASLQKPKKITIIATDGHEYSFLMKPKDDLRKDFRLMEFNNVVKQHLYEDTEARQRRLYIRTYTVLPLNDECGIIEWVQNVTPYRNILMSSYKVLGKGMPLRRIKNEYPRLRDSIDKKRQIFEQIILPEHPPVFGDWFRQRFPNPHNWYQARCSYIKTCAVMSIAGYILGLGDRHGENILLDASTGDLIHVDFNCLFNRGESFEWPELVPFRLTHNMVKAMGPLGVEGMYKKCCEITARVMREQQNTLMSVLKPFVYDPMVSWTKSLNRAQITNLERTDQIAMDHINKIENRLKGYVKVGSETSGLPLSVEGQVNHVITEATSLSNLSSMYVGWGSYL